METNKPSHDSKPIAQQAAIGAPKAEVLGPLLTALRERPLHYNEKLLASMLALGRVDPIIRSALADNPDRRLRRIVLEHSPPVEAGTASEAVDHKTRKLIFGWARASAPLNRLLALLDPLVGPKELSAAISSSHWMHRFAAAVHPATPPEIRNVLTRDSEPAVAAAAEAMGGRKTYPPLDEQIRALLCGRARELACRVLNVRKMDGRSYAEAFSVTRDQVLEWVARHGLPEGVVHDQDDESAQGFSIVRTGLRWEVVYRERTSRDSWGKFFRRKDAELAAADALLVFCGTGDDLAAQGIKSFGKLL